MTLYVDDLKYGHRWVNVVWNDQLINYAALILRKLGLFGDDRVRIVFTLVLPRCYTGRGPVQTWSATLGEIKTSLNELSAAFRAADDPNAPCDASDVEACYDCKARFDCQAFQQSTTIAIGVTSQPIPLALSPEAMVKHLRVLRDAEQRIKSMREGMEQNISYTIRRQRAVPYFALETKQGREVFADDAPERGLVEACAAFGVDVVKDRNYITPKQAIKAGVPEQVVKLYSRKNSGALVLVEDDGSEAARIFNSKE